MKPRVERFKSPFNDQKDFVFVTEDTAGLFRTKGAHVEKDAPPPAWMNKFLLIDDMLETLNDIVEADERGQGEPFKIAMDKAVKIIEKAEGRNNELDG